MTRTAQSATRSSFNFTVAAAQTKTWKISEPCRWAGAWAGCSIRRSKTAWSRRWCPVMPSAGRAFYMNFRDGSQKWEDFVMKDLLPYMRKNFNMVQGREGTFNTGISMGGMGSLRMAVKHPEIFQAVASQEPAIEPALAYDDITLRDKIGRPDGAGLQDRILLKQIYG